MRRSCSAEPLLLFFVIKKMNKLQTTWYKELLDDLRKLEFTGIVLTKWNIGKRILADFEKFGKPEYGNKRVENIAKDLNVENREVYRCIQFAEKCPDGTQLPQRSWHWIHDHYLPKSREEKIKKLLSRNNEVLPVNIKLLEGDVFDKLKEVKNKSIDLLITDPPYSVMKDYEWDKKDLKFLDKWMRAVRPKLKDDYIGFIFCDARMQFEFEQVLRSYFEVKNRLIWIRKNMALGRVIKDRFISSYEIIFYFGNKRLNLPENWGEERFDSFEYAVPQSNFREGKYHPTQKPLELFKRLIQLGSKEGELVVDIFAGSGTAGLACKELSRNCMMIEKEKEYIKIIKNRI